jgi:hypothetical protein
MPSPTILLRRARRIRMQAPDTQHVHEPRNTFIVSLRGMQNLFYQHLINEEKKYNQKHIILLTNFFADILQIFLPTVSYIIM